MHIAMLGKVMSSLGLRGLMKMHCATTAQFRTFFSKLVEKVIERQMNIHLNILQARTISSSTSSWPLDGDVTNASEERHRRCVG